MIARLMSRWGFVALLVVAVGLMAAAPPQGDRQSSRRVAALIEKLGDDDFEVRQDAERELTRIGKPGTEQLLRAALSSKDLERRRRAVKILEAVDPGALARATRAERGRANATTWGESIANPNRFVFRAGSKHAWHGTSGGGRPASRPGFAEEEKK
jgi:hypothetical protein